MSESADSLQILLNSDGEDYDRMEKAQILLDSGNGLRTDYIVRRNRGF